MTAYKVYQWYCKQVSDKLTFTRGQVLVNSMWTSVHIVHASWCYKHASVLYLKRHVDMCTNYTVCSNRVLKPMARGMRGGGGGGSFPYWT